MYANSIGPCKVHNSHCCICKSGIFPYYSIYNRSLVGFCWCFTSYIVLANDYVKPLYFYYLPTPVITGIDHIPTLLLINWVLYSSTCQQPGESQSLLYPLHLFVLCAKDDWESSQRNVGYTVNKWGFHPPHHEQRSEPARGWIIESQNVWDSVGEVWSSPVISPRMWLKYLMQMMIKNIRVFFGSFSSIPVFCLYTVPGIKVINQYDKKW